MKGRNPLRSPQPCSLSCLCIHVCLCVHASVFIYACAFFYVLSCMPGYVPCVYMCAFVSLHVRIIVSACLYAYVYAFSCVCARIHVCLCVHAFLNVCMPPCEGTCVCGGMSMFIHTWNRHAPKGLVILPCPHNTLLPGRTHQRPPAESPGTLCVCRFHCHGKSQFRGPTYVSRQHCCGKGCTQEDFLFGPAHVSSRYFSQFYCFIFGVFF